jgi:hypothetical protein
VTDRGIDNGCFGEDKNPFRQGVIGEKSPKGQPQIPFGCFKNGLPEI